MPLDLGARSNTTAGMVVNRARPRVPRVAKATMAVNRPVTEQRFCIELKNPVTQNLRAYAFRNRELAGPEPEMVQQNVHQEQTLALCGAGPSLEPKNLGVVSQVWACNSALPWLVSQGVKVDVGLAIDQTSCMLREWADPPDVTYYLASTVDPALTEHLQARGRRIKWFHNYVGWGDFDDERDHYCNDWPEGFMCGSGATVVPRAAGVAAWMGFERVDIHGADCALGGPGQDIAHANGETATEAFGKPLLMKGETNGRTWVSRPDLLMAAVDLARIVQKFPGRVRLVGDTLAAALQSKPDTYLDEVMRRLKPGEIPAAKGA